MKPAVMTRAIRRSWPASVLLLCGAQFVGAGSAQAGLFDFLFGNSAPRQPVYMTPADPHAATRNRARKATVKKQQMGAEDREGGTAARDLRTIRRLADIAREQGISAAVLQDPTLRAGDIIVTPTGFAVYEGGGRKGDQLRPLAQSRLRNRADLAQLQRASGFGLRRIEAAQSQPMPALVIHARGQRDAEFQARSEHPADEQDIHGPQRQDTKSMTVTVAP